MENLTVESIKATVAQMNQNESVFMPYQINDVKHLFEGIDVNIIPLDNGQFKMMLPHVKTQSKMSQIVDLLRNYQRSMVVVPFDIAYVRQIVSKYNAANEKDFKVGTHGDDVVVYREFEEWDVITQDEFDEYERDMVERIGEMRGRIEDIDEEIDDDEEII